jgi:hypothetical protein
LDNAFNPGIDAAAIAQIFCCFREANDIAPAGKSAFYHARKALGREIKFFQSAISSDQRAARLDDGRNQAIKGRGASVLANKDFEMVPVRQSDGAQAPLDVLRSPIRNNNNSDPCQMLGRRKTG